MSESLKNVTMQGVRIIFRNFAGREGLYNREGDRNFTVIIPDQATAEAMKADGWNIKYKEPRSAEEDGIYTLQVAVGYKIRPPRVVIITSRGRTSIPEDLVDLMDWVDMANVDLIVRPYSYNVSGRSGIKAYLKSIYVTIAEDELEQKYADVPEVEFEGVSSAPELTSNVKALNAGKDQSPKWEQSDDEDGEVVDAELIED